SRGPLTGIAGSSFSDVPESFWAWADIEEASTSHRYLRKESGAEELIEQIDLGTGRESTLAGRPAIAGRPAP
ncbi:MAG TPA: hypothetical protein VD902_14830, partial [Symbiobacteriaceae bacterium]|nr:hypothetical protein [Symbiobacteriaceae bacterium]